MAFLTLQAPSSEPVTVAQLMSYAHIDSNEDPAFLGTLIASAREYCEAFCERAFIFQTKRLLMDFFPGYVDMKLAGQRVSSPFVSGSNAVLVGIRYAIALPWPLVREVIRLQYQDPNDGSFRIMQPGVDFNVDIDSQPARLTPIFGTMWPVARVTTNAVQVDYVTGFAGQIQVSMTAGSAAIDSPFNFLPRDLGQSIAIPNAAAGGKTPLIGTIATVDAYGNATLNQAAQATATGQVTNFGAVPAQIQQAIMALASYWYESRLPNSEDIPFGVKSHLWPYRDLRL
jgi:hypothetical protein